MKITIIGAGAMGCLFAAFLQEAGCSVTLFHYRDEVARAINKHGVRVLNGEETRVMVPATAAVQDVAATDLALILVKHTATASAAAIAGQIISRDGVVLSLQNGLGNGEIIEKHLPAERMIMGSTAQGATLLSVGKVVHGGRGETVIGAWAGCSQKKVMAVADVLSSATIKTRAVKDIQPLLWRKLMVNAGINAITALTGVKNGFLPTNNYSRDLLADVVREAVTVGKAAGYISDNYEDVLADVLGVAKATSDNLSSMNQDVARQRLTEIGAINGYIVRKAEDLFLSVPVNKTLVRLIRIRESLFADS